MQYRLIASYIISLHGNVTQHNYIARQQNAIICMFLLATLLHSMSHPLHSMHLYTSGCIQTYIHTCSNNCMVGTSHRMFASHTLAYTGCHVPHSRHHIVAELPSSSSRCQCAGAEKPAGGQALNSCFTYIVTFNLPERLASPRRCHYLLCGILKMIIIIIVYNMWNQVVTSIPCFRV